MIQKRTKPNKWVQVRINENWEGSTIEQVLKEHLLVSNRMINRLTRIKGIKYQGKQPFLKQKVKTGTILEVALRPNEDSDLPGQPVPFSIVYEDDDFLVVDKPAGIKVHPTSPRDHHTLAHGIVHVWAEQGFSGIVRPVHRLDRDTSGLLLVAKNAYMHQLLDRLLRNNQIHRSYIALIEHPMLEKQGIITEPIGRDSKHPTRRKVTPQGELAITHYQVIKQNEQATWVTVKLETGKTHQIRVHFSHLGHPLAGDRLYGGSTQWIHRQALHSAKIEFQHPLSGETLVFTSSLPPDLIKAGDLAELPLK